MGQTPGLLDDEVDGFCSAVADAVGVEVGEDLGPPGAQGPSEACDLRDRAGVQRGDDVLGQTASTGRSGLVVDRSQPLVALPAQGDLSGRVAEMERDVQAGVLAVGQVLGAVS